MSETSVSVAEPVAEQPEVIEDAATPTSDQSKADESSGESKVFDADYVRSLRQEAAKYRTQAKELADKASKYDEHVESQKSEQEKIAESLDAATRERDELKHELLRLKVAQSKQLPASLVDRLRGDTEEEMLADADALLTGLKDSLGAKRPSVDQTGAGLVGEAKAPVDPLELAAAVRGRR